MANNPVERTSTKMSLLDRYNQTAILAPAPGDHSRTFNAKEVGREPQGAVDAINGSPIGASGNDVAQRDFKIRQPTGVTQFTDAGLNYSSNELRVYPKKYAPSGRLP